MRAPVDRNISLPGSGNVHPKVGRSVTARIITTDVNRHYACKGVCCGCTFDIILGSFSKARTCTYLIMDSKKNPNIFMISSSSITRYIRGYQPYSAQSKYKNHTVKCCFLKFRTPHLKHLNTTGKLTFQE